MKKKCYIYTRVSTARQVEGFSLDAQKEKLRAYAKYRDMEIAGEYSDEGKSGHSIKGRPEFTRMLDDIISEKDEISYVLVYKLSRFGRNAADVLKTMQIFSDFGVDLVSVDDAIDSSTQGGRLTLSILSAVAEIERENIKVQFAAGTSQKMQKGGWLGGPVPYGYRSRNRELEIYEPEAEIVKEIFDLYLQDGETMFSVTRHFNEKGIRRMTRAGEKPITTDFIKHTLDQPIYAGFFRYNYRSATGQPVCVAKGIHTPIVSEDVWEKTREKRVLTTKEKKEGNRISILSGLVKCPVCGRGLVRADGTKNKNYKRDGYYTIIYSYTCKGHLRTEGKVCSFNRFYNQDVLDGAVHEVVSRLGTSKEFADVLKRHISETGTVGKWHGEIKSIRKEIRSLEGQKRNLGKEMDALSFLDSDDKKKYDAMQDEIEEIYDRIEELENRLKDVEAKKALAEEGEKAAQDLSGFIDNFGSIYEKMTREERREYYRLFIDRIEVFPGKREDGRILRSISFKVPIESGKRVGYGGMEIVPTIDFEIDCANSEITAPEAKATYVQLKKYIMDKYGTKISSFYIGVMKRKYGIEVRPHYNFSKKENPHVPQCPRYKEEMIVEALVHFKMLPEGTKIIEEDAK